MKNVNISKDFISMRFGRLVVKSFSHSSNKRRFWNCICDCGNEIIKMGKNLTNGHTKSCGCLSKESSSKNSKNMYKKSSSTKRMDGIWIESIKHPLYFVWKSIKQRCFNSKCREYKWYGLRGIRISSEWINSPENFIKWGINNGYKKGLQLDRIDNNGSYEPNNCQFISKIENIKKSHLSRKSEKENK